jgi:hypothetical protein
LRQWADEDDPELREQRLGDLERLLNGADLEAVAERLPPDVIDFALGLSMFKDWMAAEPEQAAEWMSHHANVSATRVSTLVHDWEQADNEGIEQYLDTLPAGDWREKILTVIARDSLSGDAVQAVEWANRLSPGPVQTGLLQTAVTNWAQKDPKSARQWANHVSDPQVKDQLTETLAVEYARTDPAGAVDYALSSVKSDELLNRSIADIAGVWAGQDPANAAAWVAQLPDGQGRQMALGELINVWGNRDRSATSIWVNQMPQGALREQAIRMVGLLSLP